MKREESNTDRDAPEVDLIWASQEVLAIYGKTCAFDVIQPPQRSEGTEASKIAVRIDDFGRHNDFSGRGKCMGGGYIGESLFHFYERARIAPSESMYDKSPSPFLYFIN